MTGRMGIDQEAMDEQATQPPASDYEEKRLTMVRVMKVGQKSIRWRGKVFLVTVEELK